MLINYIMIQKRLHIAPKVDAISPLGVVDKPSTVGALYFTIMKEIPLTRGFITMVDDEDFESLSKLKWYAYPHRNTVYAKTTITNKNKKRNCISMHRKILGVTNGKIQVDHIDCNGLNNQRNNLRTCSPLENSYNCFSRKNSSSKYVGVSVRYYKGSIRGWIAQIKFHHEKVYIGIYKTEIEAAIARDQFVIDNNITFAKLNVLTRSQEKGDK